MQQSSRAHGTASCYAVLVQNYLVDVEAGRVGRAEHGLSVESRRAQLPLEVTELYLDKRQRGFGGGSDAQGITAS